MPQNTATSVIWISSNESVATVDKNGVVHGEMQGECNVTATVDGLTTTCKVIVEKNWSYFILDPNSKQELLVGEELNVKCLYGTQERNQIDNSNILWWSYDPNIVSIDQNGNVKALALGTTKIEAWYKYNTNRTAQMEISVVANRLKPTGISLNVSKLELDIKEKYQLIATIYPEGEATDFNWYSENENIAKVNSEGIVTAISEGVTRIRIENRFYADIQAYCEVNVKKGSTNSSEEQPTNTTPQPISDQTKKQTTNVSDSNTTTKVSKPAKVKKLKVSAKGKQKIKITWAKIKNVPFYQVQIATSKNFKKGKKNQLVMGQSFNKKKLKKGKTYYVRVRAYANGKYGAWSAVKKIKVK